MASVYQKLFLYLKILIFTFGETTNLKIQMKLISKKCTSNKIFKQTKVLPRNRKLLDL